MTAWVIRVYLKKLLFKEKIMLKSRLIKYNHRVPGINKVDTYGAPILHRIIAPV
jgi:hypothetical protein